MTTEHTVKSTAHIRDFAPDILAGHDLNATKGAAEQFVLFRLCCLIDICIMLLSLPFFARSPMVVFEVCDGIGAKFVTAS